MSAPYTTVSWEIVKYLIDDVSKGDPQAILIIVKLACPDWLDVTIDDFTVEMLGGGFSGNVPYKCSAKGKDGSLAFKVIPPEDGDADDDDKKKETMCDAAYQLWSREGIVPKAHLLGNPAAPGIEIYEFIEGSSASWLGTKHGPEFLENDEDAASFGKLLGKLHSLPMDWYEKFKDDRKPQWESWHAGWRTNAMACERRAKYGDYASQVVLFSTNFASRGKNMKELGKGCIELWPLLQEQLTTDVMSQTRVCHGDLHGCNLLHRKKDGHGDLIAIDLDFSGHNPAVIDLSTVLAGTMSGPYGYFFLKGEPVGTYPSLKSRRLVVTSYLEALGDDELCKTAVDDILYDMEIGAMIRVLWVAPILGVLGMNNTPAHAGWAYLHYSRAGCNIFEKCKTDKELKQRVIEEGVVKIFTDQMLKLGLKPCDLNIKQYKEHWDIFGNLGPAFSGPFLPDDAAPEGEEKEKVEPEPSDKISGLQAAALRFHDSTGADIKSLFDKFDTDKNGSIDLQELLGAAAMCGAGFKSLDDAKEAFASLDEDGDGAITFNEFTNFLQSF